MLPVVTGVASLNSGVTLMARVLGQPGTPITQASLSTITYAVSDLTTGVNLSKGNPLTISAVVFDALVQNDPRWTKDTAKAPGADGLAGYNFLATIPATAFTAKDIDAVSLLLRSHRYRVDVLFTPITGQPWVQAFEFTAVANFAV